MKYLPGHLLLLMSWLQPIHVLPWTGWHSELLALAALAWYVGLQWLEERRRGEVELAIPRIVCMPVLLGLYALFQFAWGQIAYFGDALMISLYMAACVMALAIGYQWAGQPARAGLEKTENTALSQLAMTVLVGAVLSVCIMLVQTLDVWGAADWIVRTGGYRRPGGNVGQPNHMATLLLMGMASLACLSVTRRVGVLAIITLQALMLLGLVMTESRTGLLSAAILSVWWYGGHGLFGKARTQRVIVGLWACLALLVWAWPFAITSLYFDSTEAAGRMNAGAGLRRVVWAQLLEAVMLHPWVGWGLREVPQAHNAVLHLYLEGAPFSYAHNFVLDLALGLGIPLTVLVLGACTRWLWRRLAGEITLEKWYGLAMLIPLVVHSLLEFPYSYAYFLVPVLLAVGAMEAKALGGAAPRVRTAYAGAGAGMLFLVMTWTAVEYVAIEEDFRVARFEALRVGQTPTEYTIPETRLLTQLDAMLKATRAKPQPGMAESEIERLRQAAMRFPWTAIQNRYALSLALNGNPEEAIRQLLVMRAMHGEKHYEGIKASWGLLAKEKYPELKQLALP
jgi:O-antigen ligase